MRHAGQLRQYGRVASGLLLLVATLLVLGPNLGAAGVIEQKKGPAILRIHAEQIENGRPIIRLSDTLHLELDIEGKEGLEVGPVSVGPAADWQARPSPASGQFIDEGETRWHRKLVLSPQQSGELMLELSPLRYREQSGPWQEAKWAPLKVTVTTEIVHADLTELRDVTPPEQCPPLASWFALAAWTAAGVGGSVLALLAALLLRRTKSTPAIPPHIWAARELTELDKIRLESTQDVELYHRRLSDVLRRYIHLRYRIPAPARTTSEFLKQTASAHGIPTQQRELVREALERCDLVKFARACPSVEESRATASLVQQFVRATMEPSVHSPDSS